MWLKSRTLFTVITILRGSIIIASAYYTHHDDDPELTVRITGGGVIHGFVDPAAPAVRQFLGIPYAQPPLGNLRFAPPLPALPFGELNATKLGSSCMQYLSNTPPNVYVNEVLEFNLAGLNGTDRLPISEDCLTLSIWTPPRIINSSNKTTPPLLPVIVFFYGGAFAAGGADVPYQIPTNWVKRSQNHIVVSFNHRDNIFGFPNAAGLDSDKQNVGLLDQRLAVEWVRDNIVAFGGDAKRIGLWGQSSGACALGYYSYSFRDDPIANSLIMDSGNEFIDILTVDPARANFTYVASQLGCGRDLTPAQELACMRRLDAGVIEDFLRQYNDAGTTPLLTFSPVVDNTTVFRNYTALLTAQLPALIGSNAQDGVPFVLPYDPTAGVDVGLADQTTKVFFFCPTYRAALVRSGSSKVYRYLYAGNFTNVSPKGWMGAYHAAEMPLVFGTHALFRGHSSALEDETSAAMQDVWVAFVATAGEEMPDIEGLDGGAWVEGQVVEFGNGVPARVLDTAEMDRGCDFS
ncbi:acetylcholinesterase [Apodospora peruviana]|uniref:Carboxylic ester hydrolase n=1 Tax=Apodospora peruviana TaxID=516989 RepID=A0AAE0I518_9PEZI|nr:acetylcholinesterase [Apodospora peruviana]